MLKLRVELCPALIVPSVAEVEDMKKSSSPDLPLNEKVRSAVLWRMLIYSMLAGESGSSRQIVARGRARGCLAMCLMEA